MKKNPQIRLSSVILCLSSALDLVNWLVVNHHRQVAGVASKIAKTLGCSDEDKDTITTAAALHDIGGICFNEKFSLAFDAEGMSNHSEIGYYLLRKFKPFASAAELVRYHHLPWDGGRGAEKDGKQVQPGSHVLHLADRVAVLIDTDQPILKQAGPIAARIRKEQGKKFMPEVVDAFLHLADREYFWLDTVNPTSDFGAAGPSAAWNRELDLHDLLDLSELFRIIIDFRSPTTATHSKDVAHLSEALAGMIGFSGQEALRIHIAGNLHDIGKLAVPVEILEKKGPLDQDELHTMRSHSFYTYRILERIGRIDDICEWASLHHECVDGTGYPFRYGHDQLPLGARIITVADIFSALTEDRSYRSAMSYDVALGIMQRLAREGKIDPMIVSLVEKQLPELRSVKIQANDQALQEFHQARKESHRG
jgi:HD-GYP domain-containing protein (c-di-GMP phosphodiesterase class II)